MKIQTSVLCLTLGLCAAAAFAQRAQTLQTQPQPQPQPQQRIPAHNPEFSHPTTGDPGRSSAQPLEIQRAAPADSVAEDLQRIVVLCATQPQSQAFETAWTSYVRTHYRRGVDLDALIDEVLQRAEAHRASAGNTSRNATRVAINPNTTRLHMHDTAMAVIRKIG